MSLILLLCLNILPSSYALPNPEAMPEPDLTIQVIQSVGGGYGSGSSGSLEENDDHDEGSCSHWKYPSTNWPDICPGYCSGQSQSPIDIVTSPLPMDNSLFRFHDYGVPINTVNLNNNGHSATISWDNSVNSLSISGGGLDGNYTLAQFHFHWGCDNSQGSEHTVDGHSYPMELHLVHYKTAYGSLGEAIKHSDGLAVLGIFIEVGSENLALKPITDNLYQITEAGVDVDIPYNEKIEDVLPTSSDSFYRYLGSLTTPTCNEVVIWSVIKNTIEISQAQLDAFRSIKDHEGHSICDNFRYVQPLNGRTVTKFN